MVGEQAPISKQASRAEFNSGSGQIQMSAEKVPLSSAAQGMPQFGGSGGKIGMTGESLPLSNSPSDPWSATLSDLTPAEKA